MTIKGALFAVLCAGLLGALIVLAVPPQHPPTLDGMNTVAIATNGDFIVVVLSGEGKELGLFYTQEGLEFYCWTQGNKMFIRERGATVEVTLAELNARISSFLKEHTAPPQPDRRVRA